MKTITKTYDELLAFIREQPDERKVNMEQPRGEYDCGCLLVHFLSPHFPNPKHCFAGFCAVDDANLCIEVQPVEQASLLIRRLVGLNVKSYGEIKRLLSI